MEIKGYLKMRNIAKIREALMSFEKRLKIRINNVYVPDPKGCGGCSYLEIGCEEKDCRDW